MSRSPVNRPSRVPYKWGAVARLGARVLNPPPAPCQVRSLRIAPDYKIELNDILDNKHLPPMALKDFEEYLLFTEYTCENLYFIMWLRDYTKVHESYSFYRKSVGNDKTPATSGDLAIRYSRALTTFFGLSSPLALNLSHSLSEPIIAMASSQSHPDPQAFEKVHEHVRDLLNQSLQRFVKRSYGNAGKNRSLFSVICGILNILIATGMIVHGVLMGGPRAMRLINYPFYILGFLFLFAGMHGLCVIIFVFAGADARQLHTYELAAPQIPETVGTVPGEKDPKANVVQMPSAGVTTTDLDSLTTADDDERKLGTPSTSIRILDKLYDDEKSGDGATTHVREIDLEAGPEPPATRASSITDFLYTASFIPNGSFTSASPTIVGECPPSPVYKFDFDALPSHPPVGPGRASIQRKDSTSDGSRSTSRRSLLSSSSPTFGGLTRVLNPIVRRSNRDIAVRSFLASVIISSLLMIAAMLIPPCTHHKHQ
ncbi:hypothetical protein FRB94_000844 [Tulasnella sp. JGI-2019a]|nr:hypothetical protein FRB94_000844 [Tulasnella sp. JGI-2019a]